MVEIDGFEEIRPGTMYTQCPDCSTAFRVTADVLKQAAGNVRCGGCGSAFNALDYLSESKPAQPPQREAEAALPELKPDPVEDDDGLPAAISAEQSAALLKTLDELAGSDIRIEDTGVEWRVLDDDEVGEAADDEIAIDVEVEDQPQIDEILDESPTPVDQFLTDTPPEIDSPEIFAEGNNEPGQTPVEELRFDDNTPLPDDFGLDDDEPYVPATGPQAEPEPEPIAAVSEQADLDLSEPDEWTDILDEFEDLASDLSGPDHGTGEEGTEHDDETPAERGDETSAGHGEEAPAERHDEAPEDLEEVFDEPAASDDEADNVLAADALLDMDSQFALQAEAMGIELSGTYEVPDSEEELARDEIDDLDTLLEEHSVAEPDLEDLLEEEVVDEIGEEAAQLELIGDEDDAGEAAPDVAEETRLDFDIPPMTEEEQTINLQIDQDLLAVAVEDEDGFASTMVLAEDAAAEPFAGEEAADEAGAERAEDVREDGADESLLDTSAGFETIIMEGEHVRSDHEDDDLAAQAAAVASLADAAATERAAQDESSEGKTRYGLVASIIVLLALLGGQYLHQSRNTLATIPAFNNVAGPVYRAIGQPLSPAWDITGWRFEATKGSTSEDDANLTVYSRIGNNSDQPLPYPLISISLTDRFEETIGSRVLEPADYLPDDLDPSKLVQPGNTFNAVITISSPDANAVSFRLRACYRAAGGQLRCKDDGFK